jgi:integrase
LKNITLKTVFLVALATAQRRSELHALSYEREGGYITLKTVFLVALATAQRRSELHALSYEREGGCPTGIRARLLAKNHVPTPLGVRLLSLPCQQ